MQFVQTKSMKSWQGILFGLIFVFVGIGLLLFSISNIIKYNQKNKTYTETTSIVVDYANNTDGLKAIIVEYKVDGIAYKKQSNTYSNTPRSKGTKVNIKYNPDDPSDAIWVNDSSNIMLPLLGGLFTLVGIIFVVNIAKKMKYEKEEETPAIQQSNGLYNSADVVNSLQNNQNIGQQTSQVQQTVPSQTEQGSQYQQSNQQQNQVQGTFTQNTNYSNGQNQMNNQNNMNSNL